MYALAHADIPHLMAPQHVPVLSMGVCYSASIFTISRAGHLLIIAVSLPTKLLVGCMSIILVQIRYREFVIKY